MKEIIILESIETDYEQLKLLVLTSFKKEIINPEYYEFEEYYIIIQLKNEQLSLKICNALNKKHFDNLLLEFIQYLTDEGIETFISKSKNKVEIFFSKFVGMEEDLIDSDKKIIEYERDIKILSLSEIVFNILCSKNKMFR